VSELLYLDTARMGRVSPGAAAALRDFVALAGDEGAGLYFDRFLVGGLTNCPTSFAGRYPGLADWRGVGPLKTALRSLADDNADLPTLFASRSTPLVRFAARLLFHPCRNVLATDLDWPPWSAILATEAVRAGRTITTVSVRDAALSGRLASEELIDLLCERFAEARCDGLYLTAVSNLGIRTPVERLVTRLEATHVVRAVVVDGAQDFCQVRPTQAVRHCDFYLAGSHKWLRGYHPLGIGFYGRTRSRRRVETILAEMLAAGDLDDPLLTFSARLESGTRGPVSETVNLASLFAAQGAAADAHQTGCTLDARLENLHLASEAAAAAGWEPVLPSPDLRSGILLVRSAQRAAHSRDPEELRAALRDRGIAATTYGGGVVRLSMPARRFRPGELDHLRDSLSAVL
jgi:selenocysteine lyase/cysteine desulfurase